MSDAERAEVADRLSQHYSDGRLDQDEFSERLDKAMGAKTHADLAGLFDDLPPTSAPAQPPAHVPRRRGRGWNSVLFLVLVIALVVLIGHVAAHSFVPWLLIAILAFLWLRHGPRRRYRR